MRAARERTSTGHRSCVSLHPERLLTRKGALLGGLALLFAIGVGLAVNFIRVQPSVKWSFKAENSFNFNQVAFAPLVVNGIV